MDAGKTGWLQEFIEFRKVVFKDYQISKRKTAHPEQALYKIIQPTGIMYGQSVAALDFPDSGKWSEKTRLKILLAESLFGSSIIFYDKPLTNEIEIQQLVEHTLKSVSSFYGHVFPELRASERTWLGKKKSAIEMAEQVLEKRVEKIESRTKSFWVNYFQNSLLFIDIYIFGQWIHTSGDAVISDYFKYQREELRFSVVKIITSAAHANHTLEFEERKLMEYFLQSAALSAERKKEAKSIFEQGIEIEALDLPTNNSWILRKYFLEMAILTIWADKQVEDVEIDFLKRLAKHLNFSEDELDNSQLALEGFVIQHWKELDQLKNKQALQEVGEQFIKRMAHVVSVNKVRLKEEIKSSPKMMALLKQAKHQELNPNEQEELTVNLLVILRTIPNFSVITLPHDFLTLPVLMKILPANFFAEILN